jgi:hypothetical protein
LNELAAPATGLTIAYTLLFAPAGTNAQSHTFFPQSLARHAYPHLVESATRLQEWLSLLLKLMIGAVVATSLASWYVAYGNLVLQRIEQLDSQRAQIGEALNSIRGISPATASSVPTRGTPSEAWLRGERELVDHLSELMRKASEGTDAAKNQVVDPLLERAYDAAVRLNSKRIAADEALDEWTLGVASWLLRATTDETGTVTERKEQWAANFVAVLGNYVLPMMYGFLGAAAAIMVNLNQKVRTSRLSPRDRRMSRVQLVLGIITGACIGLFLIPSPADPDSRGGFPNRLR